MGFETLNIERRSIARDHLNFDYTKADTNIFGDSIAQSKSAIDTDTTIEITANENLTAPCAVGADGKKASTTNPAIGILLRNTLSGYIANLVIRSQKTTITGATFTPGRFVYLCDSTPNMTTALGSSNTNKYIQRLGIALSSSEISADISPPVMCKV